MGGEVVADVAAADRPVGEADLVENVRSAAGIGDFASIVAAEGVADLAADVEAGPTIARDRGDEDGWRAARGKIGRISSRRCGGNRRRGEEHCTDHAEFPFGCEVRLLMNN